MNLPMAWTQSESLGCESFLRKLAAKGHTILVSSHQLAEMQHTVDDVIILNKGRVIASGSVQEIIGDGTLEEAFIRLVESAA